MTADRPYRRALDPADVRAELERGAGGQFDRAVVVAFLASLEGDRVETPLAAVAPG
jgi:HD-GYP domain-containing protein (c-di-GMP phosphodiesterase class II)